MSSYPELIYNRLAADDALTNIVQVFNSGDVPVEGINRDNFPQAYDLNALLTPILIVKGRGNIPTSGLRAYKTTSTRQIVELWLYDDRDEGWDAIEQAAELCYGLLQDERVTGTFQMRLFNEIDNERDVDMGNACMLRRDYEVIGYKSA